MCLPSLCVVSFFDSKYVTTMIFKIHILHLNNQIIARYCQFLFHWVHFNSKVIVQKIADHREECWQSKLIQLDHFDTTLIGSTAQTRRHGISYVLLLQPFRFDFQMAQNRQKVFTHDHTHEGADAIIWNRCQNKAIPSSIISIKRRDWQMNAFFDATMLLHCFAIVRSHLLRVFVIENLSRWDTKGLLVSPWFQFCIARQPRFQTR